MMKEPFYIDSQEVNTKEHNYEWKRGYNLRQFTMDQTFYKPGIIPVSGGQVSCGDQWLQRTIFTTERSFPSFTKRIRVISKKIIELEPIDNALEYVKSKSQSLSNVLNLQSSKTKILIQQILQSILLNFDLDRKDTHGGIQGIARVFLSVTKNNYPLEKREQLNDALVKLNRLVGHAINFCCKSKSEDDVLSEKLIKAYKSLTTELNTFQGTGRSRSRAKLKQTRSPTMVNREFSFYNSSEF